MIDKKLFEGYLVRRRGLLNARIDNYLGGKSKSEYGATFQMLILLQVQKLWIEETEEGKEEFGEALLGFEEGIKMQLGVMTVYGDSLDRAVHQVMEEISLLMDAFKKATTI